MFEDFVALHFQIGAHISNIFLGKNVRKKKKKYKIKNRFIIKKVENV